MDIAQGYIYPFLYPPLYYKVIVTTPGVSLGSGALERSVHQTHQGEDITYLSIVNILSRLTSDTWGLPF